MGRGIKILFFIADMFAGAVLLIAAGFMVSQLLNIVSSDLPAQKEFVYLIGWQLNDSFVALMTIAITILHALQLWTGWWTFRRNMLQAKLFIALTLLVGFLSGVDYLFWFYSISALVVSVPWIAGYIEFKRAK